MASEFDQKLNVDHISGGFVTEMFIDPNQKSKNLKRSFFETLIHDTIQFGEMLEDLSTKLMPNFFCNKRL